MGRTGEAPSATDSVTAEIGVVGGAGHVGLPLCLVLASHGHKVLCYDTSEKALVQIATGEMPFMEEGAPALLREILPTGKLVLSHDPKALEGVRKLVVTVGTPVDEFLNPELRVIQACMDTILPYLGACELLILRSTVYPGTTEKLHEYLAQKGYDMEVSFCPERIVQGQAVRELQNLPQIVSGTTQRAEDAAADFFGEFAPSIVRLPPIEAEFAKLFSNAWRYMQFAMTNQFYVTATAVGADYNRILEGMKRDYDRMRDIPSAGFSAGPCLFKDTMQLVSFNDNHFGLGYQSMLVNEGLPQFIVDRLAREHDLKSMTVGLLGMAFKANIDDTRSSLSYKMKKILGFRAGNVLTTDPYVVSDETLRSLDEVLDESDLIILCTPHDVYRDLDLKGKIVCDIWNFWGNDGSAD